MDTYLQRLLGLLPYALQGSWSCLLAMSCCIYPTVTAMMQLLHCVPGKHSSLQATQCNSSSTEGWTQPSMFHIQLTSCQLAGDDAPAVCFCYPCLTQH